MEGIEYLLVAMGACEYCHKAREAYENKGHGDDEWRFVLADSIANNRKMAMEFLGKYATTLNTDEEDYKKAIDIMRKCLKRDKDGCCGTRPRIMEEYSEMAGLSS